MVLEHNAALIVDQSTPRQFDNTDGKCNTTLFGHLMISWMKAIMLAVKYLGKRRSQHLKVCLRSIALQLRQDRIHLRIQSTMTPGARCSDIEGFLVTVVVGKTFDQI
jgi:hypothetical protein